MIDSALLPSYVSTCKEHKANRRMLKEAKRLYDRIGGSSKPYKLAKRMFLASLIRELSFPMHKVSVPCGRKRPFVCMASSGAILEWRRAKLKVNVIERDTVRAPRFPKLVTFGDKFTAFEDKASLRHNQTGLGLAQNGYRLARLFEESNIPDHPVERGKYHAWHWELTSSFFYYWLLEGKIERAIKRSPPMTVTNAIALLDEELSSIRPQRNRLSDRKPATRVRYEGRSLVVERNGCILFHNKWTTPDWYTKFHVWFTIQKGKE